MKPTFGLRLGFPRLLVMVNLTRAKHALSYAAEKQACGSFPEVFFFLPRLWAPLHLRDALADCLGVRQAPGGLRLIRVTVTGDGA